ncbi:MAG: SMC family ATPase [Actinomycetota bacterium]
MRPVRLELEGFSTFRDRVELDFDGIDLVAFTGPTGAGKSTLIDAITFALYGSVARYDNTNRVAPVIHQLSAEARVRLDFESGRRRYTAVRVIRRRSSKGREADGATTREARLERVEDGGSTTVLAGDVRELNAAVEDLLGLDFAQFTRTIVLPQGEFAAFLRDDQASRDKLLQRLLDLGIYERMGQLARSRAKDARIRLEMLDDQRRRLAPPSDEDVAAEVDRVDALDRLRTAVDAGLARLDEIDRALDPLRDRVTAIDDARSRLATTIVVPDEVDGLDRQLVEAGGALAAIERAVAEAGVEREQAMAVLGELPDKADLVRMQSVDGQVAEARADVDDLVGEAGELTGRIEELGREVERLEAEVVTAESTMRSARQRADAAEWTAALVVGEPCPVCHRDVIELPDHDATGEVETAEQRHHSAAQALRKASRELTKLTERDRLLAEEVARQRERIDLLELQRSTLGDPDAVGEIGPLLERIDEAEAAGRGAGDRLAALEAERSAAVAAADELDRAARRLQTDLVAGRDAVADLGPPPLENESLTSDYRTLAAWAATRGDELEAERVELADEGKRRSQQRAELLDGLTAAAADAGIDAATEAGPGELGARVAEARTAAEARLTDARRRIDEDRELAAAAAELDAGRILDDALGRHLRAGGFGSWLLAEALDSIVERATVWLRELSGQQYSLVAGERAFAIVDHHNADETRDVRTLSGGETFLASLALALALADSIAELAPVDAPQLESMFLDEGFGTLDPGTLDVVAGAMEELASSGRMIGVVTHVADLAERMPAQFQVRKGPTTSTVELVAR